MVKATGTAFGSATIIPEEITLNTLLRGFLRSMRISRVRAMIQAPLLRDDMRGICPPR